jgi:hypothetical protein
VTSIGDGDEVPERPVPRVVACNEGHAAVEDLECCFSGVLVFVELRAGTQRDEGLAEGVLVSSVDGVGAPTAGGLGRWLEVPDD